MTTAPLHLFVNPTAGRGRASRRMGTIESILRSNGLEPIVHHSHKIGDLENRICEQVSAGAARIIVVGGDGSIHEAVNGILTSDRSAALGVIPSGTGNDFAKAAAIPLDWEAATTLLADRLASNASPRPIDAGRMNDRFFANGAGVGFDAKVTRIARDYRWPIGDLVYLFAIFRAMADGIATPDVFITDGDETIWQGPLTLANISNGPWVGGMFHIAPMASNSDGRLDLLIAAPVSRLRITALLPKLVRGRHMDEPEITHVAVRKVTVQADVPLPSHLDGEVQPLQSSFDIEILPGALRLI